MTEWNEPLPEPKSDVIEPPIDSGIETGIEPERDEPLENPEDEDDIINDADGEPDDEDIPLVDATENRR
jgi:hypothetical protein